MGPMVYNADSIELRTWLQSGNGLSWDTVATRLSPRAGTRDQRSCVVV